MSSTDEKVIAVIGATGQQGANVDVRFTLRIAELAGVWC